MSIEQARALVERTMTDAQFVQRLADTPIEERRAILVEEGYGDVKLRHLSEALPRAAGGELSDEEFSSVVGGNQAAADAVTAAFSIYSGTVVSIAGAGLIVAAL